ncbi:hypothetical protein, partial [Klebsiella pneumoniae]|uniref:hypothetical protein n=1 Tax=Klebsiella pneumoniae TaxID=573 RepID=UPI0024DEDD9F
KNHVSHAHHTSHVNIHSHKFEHVEKHSWKNVEKRTIQSKPTHSYSHHKNHVHHSNSHMVIAKSKNVKQIWIEKSLLRKFDKHLGP